MYYVDRVQEHGPKQRKIAVPKKFWEKFPVGCLVKVSILDNPSFYYVDTVQAQGKLQRRIPVPKKFWKMLKLDAFVRIDLMQEKME